jgi:low temperature requirement protein LtrA
MTLDAVAIPGSAARPPETAAPAGVPDPAAADTGDADRLTSPVELLWDLVFVFAITQVTTLLSQDLSWTGLGRSMLVLALVWWAWSAFVWAANAHETESATVRAALLAAMLLIFVAGLAIPRAFGTEATLFAVSYAGVRVVHLALYADASRRGNASMSAIAGFAITVTAGMVLLIIGSLLAETPRIALWTAAAAIDYAGPAWLTRERLRDLQRIAVAHFAERYGLFIIICLGESIIAIGLGAGGRAIDAALIATVTAGLLITIGMWWTYFHHFAKAAAQRLREHVEPVLAAADAYSYLHLVLVAGIIVFAVGMRTATQHPEHTLDTAARLALCGGVALYLVGHAAFVLRVLGTIRYQELLAATAILAFWALSGQLAAWCIGSAVAAILAILCGLETRLGLPQAAAAAEPAAG